MVYNLKMLKKKTLASIIILVLAAALIMVIPAAGQTTPADDLINAINQLRASKNLPALTANPALMSAAQAQADFLASSYDVAKGGDGSVGDRGTLPHDRAYQYGYSLGFEFTLVENWVVLPQSMTTEQIIKNDWWKDEYHQKNLLDGWGTTYQDIGIGIAKQGPLVFYIVDIGAVTSTVGKIVITNEAGEQYTFIPVAIATAGADGSIFHTVMEGENLELIAMSYGISKIDLITVNNLSEQSLIIRPGQVLIIKSGTGEGGILTTNVPTATATIAPSFTPRPKRTLTPQPTQVTASVTATLPQPAENDSGSSSFVVILVIVLILGGLGMLVYLLISMRKRK